jgi:hypothetical protein
MLSHIILRCLVGYSFVAAWSYLGFVTDNQKGLERGLVGEVGVVAASVRNDVERPRNHRMPLARGLRARKRARRAHPDVPEQPAAAAAYWPRFRLIACCEGGSGGSSLSPLG